MMPLPISELKGSTADGFVFHRLTSSSFYVIPRCRSSKALRGLRTRQWTQQCTP